MTGRFISGALGLLLATALLALGLWRLDLEHRQKALEGAQKANVQECLPSVELPADAVVFVSAPSPGGSAPAGAVPLTFNALVTSAIRLDKSDGDATPAKPVFIHRAQTGAASFELRPSGGAALQVHQDAMAFKWYQARHGPVRFAPAPSVSYQFEASDPKTAITTAADGTRTLAAGSEGTVVAEGAVPLQTLHPLFVSRTTQPIEAELHPIRVSGQPGLSSVSVEVRQRGLGGKPSFSACAWSANDLRWYTALIAEHGSSSDGGAKVLISLPPNTFPQGEDFAQPVQVALATADGRYLAMGRFQAVSRQVAAGAATGIVVLLLLIAMVMRARQFEPGQIPGGRPWLSGLFMGQDGDPSLSLWQMLVWTIVTVWGMFYVFIVSGSLLVLTPEVMGLLGIAGTGSVLARFIAGSAGSTSQRAGTPAAQRPANGLLQMLCTNGQFDLLKLQLFVFTAIVAIYVISRIADAAAFPALDANTLLLMGVSEGVYIASKAASSTGIARAVALKAEFEVNAEQQKGLDARLAQARLAEKGIGAAVLAAKATGATAPPELLKQQSESVEIARELEASRKVAVERSAALKLDFDKAVRELGLL
jgi:hypothetical protein